MCNRVPTLFRHQGWRFNNLLLLLKNLLLFFEYRLWFVVFLLVAEWLAKERLLMGQKEYFFQELLLLVRLLAPLPVSLGAPWLVRVPHVGEVVARVLGDFFLT